MSQDDRRHALQSTPRLNVILFVCSLCTGARVSSAAQACAVRSSDSPSRETGRTSGSREPRGMGIYPKRLNSGTKHASFAICVRYAALQKTWKWWSQHSKSDATRSRDFLRKDKGKTFVKRTVANHRNWMEAGRNSFATFRDPNNTGIETVIITISKIHCCPFKATRYLKLSNYGILFATEYLARLRKTATTKCQTYPGCEIFGL